MKKPATGRREGDGVLVDDVADANRLHNKSHAGIPETGNTLRLHPVEAAHCIDMGWLTVHEATATDLLQGGYDVAAIAYSDLRDRGLAVRIQDDRMQVWNRGQARQGEPWFTTTAVPERRPMVPADVDTDTVSVVDEDGNVTHFHVADVMPQGDVRETELPVAEGRLFDDRVVVAEAPAEWLRARFGTPHGHGCTLSLIEAAHLQGRGFLHLDGDATDHAKQHHPDHELVAEVDSTLRAAGVLPKSGFRFGTHLRAYEKDMDDVHARWLIQCVASGDALDWHNLSRGIRLAHGVRKEFLTATVTLSGPVRFQSWTWFRP